MAWAGGSGLERVILLWQGALCGLICLFFADAGLAIFDSQHFYCGIFAYGCNIIINIGHKEHAIHLLSWII